MDERILCIEAFVQFLETVKGNTIKITELITYDCNHGYDRHHTIMTMLVMSFVEFYTFMSGMQLQISDKKSTTYGISLRKIFSFSEVNGGFEVVENIDVNTARKTIISVINK